jgi:MinD superfamily P-loop ATPase
MTDFAKRRWEIDRARQKKMSELMAEYDRIEDCNKIGHYGGKYQDNGFGWSWYYCSGCGVRYNITGPNQETKHA